MVRTVRALVIAVVVAASLLGSASVASADPIGVQPPAPFPTLPGDICWE